VGEYREDGSVVSQRLESRRNPTIEMKKARGICLWPFLFGTTRGARSWKGFRSTLARTESRPIGSQGARTHSKTRTQRWRHIAERVATARAPPVCADLTAGVGAQPVAASVALRIDTLHSEARQILHDRFPPENVQAEPGSLLRALFECVFVIVGANCGARCVWCQEKTLLHIGVRLMDEENALVSPRKTL
jgi:hypothetical protein